MCPHNSNPDLLKRRVRCLQCVLDVAYWCARWPVSAWYGDCPADVSGLVYDPAECAFTRMVGNG